LPNQRITHHNILPTSVTHSRWQRVRDKLLPNNSRRRHYYELGLSSIKVISNEGWLTFMKKLKPYIIREIRTYFDAFTCMLPRFSGLNKEKRETEIIVSITSYPSRINAARIVLGKMLRQTCKPDKILLYLAKEQFRDKKIPIWLRLQNKCGIEIIYCNNLKPHTKYFYTMQKYPDAITITVDDDNYYEKNFVECLYQSYKKHPDAVSARRTNFITFDKGGQINPFIKWKKNYSEIIDQPRIKLFALGVGGVLYPPHCMHNELFNEEKLRSLCLIDDDMWLKIMQVMNNTPVVQVAKYQDEYAIWGTQKTALWLINENKTDVHLQNILKEYNEYFGEDDTLIKRLKGGV
jgi:hypothetical protein